MNLQDIQKLVGASVPGAEVTFACGTKVEIVMDDDFDLEFVHLEVLAAALGTKNINIQHVGYLTPGNEGYVAIVVTMSEPVA